MTSKGDFVPLPSPHEAIDVRVRVGTYRDEFLDEVRGAAEVLLRAPLRVRLVLRSDVPLPGWPGPLRADLWLDDRKASRNVADGWFTDARPELALLVWTTGRLRVRWWQHYEGIAHSGPRPVELGPPFTIDVLDVPEEQVFELRIPAEEVQRLRGDPR